jgi:hypothetical protein
LAEKAFCYIISPLGLVAQSVEQRIENAVTEDLYSSVTLR